MWVFVLDRSLSLLVFTLFVTVGGGVFGECLAFGKQGR